MTASVALSCDNEGGSGGVGSTARSLTPQLDLGERGLAVKATPEYVIGDVRLPPQFWARVRVTVSGCWEWTGATSSGPRGGYGRFYCGGRSVAAHRASYEALAGPIPDGLQIDHLCRNHPCVNPAHLEPVTIRENVRRGITGQVCRERSARVTHCPKGHEYTPDNTSRGLSGSSGYVTRKCRACMREAQRRLAQARREAANKDQDSRSTQTYREQILTARKSRTCDSAGCVERIEPGDQYLLAKEYPGGESGYADAAGKPIRLHLCRKCAPHVFGTGNLDAEAVTDR